MDGASSNSGQRPETRQDQDHKSVTTSNKDKMDGESSNFGQQPESRQDHKSVTTSDKDKMDGESSNSGHRPESRQDDKSVTMSNKDKMDGESSNSGHRPETRQDDKSVTMSNKDKMDGESSNSGHRPEKRPRQKRGSRSQGISYEKSVSDLSSEGRATLRLVNKRRRKGPLNSIPETSVTVFDNTSPHYVWLRPGWIAEERLKPHHRLYRYYYDPLGQMYMTRYEVDLKCADIEQDIEKNRVVIILD